MKKLICFTLLLLFTTALAFGQKVPTCNAFSAPAPSGIPVYSPLAVGATTLVYDPLPPSGTGNPLCTDFFGVANYANSPLPTGPVDTANFTFLDGGVGYSAPTVTITDFYGITPNVLTCSATVDTSGMIIAIGGCAGTNAGFMAPVVNITDVNGSGAIVLAQLASADVGTGIPKFVDALPDLKGAIASADQATFAAGPPSDYYEIALVETTAQMHTNLPATRVRGYIQVPTGSSGCPAPPYPYNYLGPVIVAQKNRPVRVKFTNCLPSTANGGNLFIPADDTYMGAGMGPDGVSPYFENRATLHLHGGNTPWISDGTPHQWTVPVSDYAGATYKRGVSTRFVPDMWFDASGAIIGSCAGLTTCSVAGATNDPGPGSMTFYWTNEQGGRLMFYHDHAYGITRLNVYAGEAAGYLLVDPAGEEDSLAAATVPGTIGSSLATTDLDHLIPLVIQDKTFVPSAAQLAAEDPTWVAVHGGGTMPGTPSTPGTANMGDLWFNHIYPPNQNPNDNTGANAFGRWDYGAWFFPPQTTLSAATPNTAITIPCTSAAYPDQLLGPSTANPVGGCPIIPNPTGTPEGFMDTPVVNGKAYPVLHVKAEAYRFRILTAGNDRALHLSLYQACSNGVYTSAATNCAPAIAAGVGDKEIPMVPAVRGGPGTTGYVYPDQLDGRLGGVPDSTAKGPSWYQIGTEGGLLPNVAVIPPTAVGYEYGRRSITVLNVSTHGLLLGPAERADVVVDFSNFAGKTLIMYNDAPAPIPAFDSRIDYFTGDLDQVQQGGAPATLPGYGPNTRTIMQIVVDPPSGSQPAFTPATLQAALPGIFQAATAPVAAIVPEPTYPAASGGNSATATYARIQDNTISFTPISSITAEPCTSPNYPDVVMPGGTPTCVNMDQKAIQELFTLDYGRMNATLGTELPLTNFLVQTTLPFGYAEWATEIIQDGHTQLWKLTHNGVDTHFIHFHLFNVQVVNRIGWDGMVKPPDANELGWKDTVRMNPLEDIVVALQPLKQNLPWPLPDSIRSMDVTMPDNGPSPMLSGIDPATGNAIPGGVGTTNKQVNFGWEYVWHCHILGHEENDMMRPIIFQVAPPAPAALVATAPSVNQPAGVALTWTDSSASETSFTVERDTLPGFTNTDPGYVTFTIDANTNGGTTGFNTLGFGQTITFIDTTAQMNQTYFYRVFANDDFTPNSPLALPFQTVPMASAPSNVATVNTAPLTPTVSFTGAPLSAAFNSTFLVTATTNSSSVPSITGNAACSVGPVSGTAASATALVTMTSGTGTCTLTATWASDAFFLGATANQSTTATPIAPTVTFTGAPATSGYLSTFTVTATTNAAIAPTITGNSVCSAAAVLGTSPATSLITMTSGTGTCTLTASWPATANYTAAIATQSTTATLAVPVITWNTPAPIVYGTALSGTQLNATAAFNGNPVPGVFTYTPAAGAVLNAGNRTLSVSFTPTDTTTFTTATATVTLTVNPAPLVITASSPKMTYGGPVPAITPASYNAFVNGDTQATAFTTLPTCTTVATSASPASPPTYASSCSGAVAPNYSISYVSGAVTVNKAPATPHITTNLPNPSIYGQIVTISFNVTPQFSGTPSGSVTVTASSGETCSAALVNGAGSCTITFLSGGSRTLTAAYGGDSNFLAGGPSIPATQVVSNISLSTTSLLFGNQLVGTISAAQTVTMDNVGTSTITISSIVWSSNFSDSNNCGGSLAPGRSCRINVRFAPTTTGVLNGTLTITDSDVTSPQIIRLTGTGVQPAAVLSPTSLTFGPIARRTSQTQTITLSNPGTAPLAIAGISIGGANPNQFSQTNSCGNALAIGATCNINVTFSSRGAGTFTAVLSISDNAQGSPQTVSLTGIAQ